MEEPPASTDIYGYDIGIAFKSENSTWANASNQGCVKGESNIHPTVQDKQDFKQVVDEIHELAKKCELK